MSDNHTKIDHLLDEEKKSQDMSASGYSKEGEPRTIAPESKPEQDVELSEPEPTIEDKEVEKFIKVENTNIELDPALKKAGLQVIDSSSLDPKHNIKLPISDEKIVQGLHQPVNSSWRWLSELAQFMLNQAHISLKKIHGHVVRVIKK